MSGSVIAQIRRAVVRQTYQLTDHAYEGLVEDDIDEGDLESALMAGRIRKVETDDPKGHRFTIVGPGRSGTFSIGIVGRFVRLDTFLVITVYRTRRSRR